MLAIGCGEGECRGSSVEELQVARKPLIRLDVQLDAQSAGVRDADAPNAGHAECRSLDPAHSVAESPARKRSAPKKSPNARTLSVSPLFTRRAHRQEANDAMHDEMEPHRGRDTRNSDQSKKGGSRPRKRVWYRHPARAKRCSVMDERRSLLWRAGKCL